MVIMPLIGGKKKKQEGIGIAPQENTALTPQSIFDPATAQRAAGFEETPAGRTVAYGDGRVRATAGGQEFDMTKEDYEIAMRYKAGMPSSPEQIEAFRKAMGPAFMGVGEKVRAKEEEQQRMADIAGRIGADPTQQGMVDPQTGQPVGETTPIDNEQMWAQLKDPSNLQSIVVAGAAGGWALSKVGATVGTFVAPGVGTAAGGAIGGFVGAVGGVALSTWKVLDKNIKDQRTDTIGAQLSINRDTITWKNQLATLANVDPTNAETYFDAWQEADRKQRAAWQQLQIDSRTDLNLRLGEDATRELQRFENYFEGGGYFVQSAKMQKAITTPDFTEGVYGLMMASQMIGGEE